MRASSILLALVGLAVAGGSAQLARELMTAPKADAASGQSVVTIMTAATEIRRGDLIQPYMLKAQSWPAEAVPAGSFTDPAMLLPAEEGGEPRRALRSLVAGEVVLESKISGFGEKVTIAQSLSPNARAMAIKVDAVTAVGGFVTPGDYVDVLLTRGDAETLMTDTILRNIRVVAVDQSDDELSEKPDVAATVTVEVTAEQGQVIALAQRAGTLSLALRTPDSKDVAPIERLRLSDLVPEPAVDVAEAAAPVVLAAPPPRRTVLVRRGTETQEVTLKN
ncbi:MAG: Flp pilus assembly protein CpaB [Pseudomonadota bacterium]